MEKKTPPRIKKTGLPLNTLSIVFTCSLVSIFPEAHSVMLYDRDAIAEGEIWRLVSCNLVHFNHIHLLYNLLAFGIAGFIIERNRYPHFISFCFILSLIISLSIYILEPNMAFYGGLSGLTCGAIVYFCCWGLQEEAPWRTICQLLLLLLAAKICIEFFSHSSILPYFEHKTIHIAPLGHLAGSIGAFFIYKIFEKIYKNTMIQPIKNID